MADLCFDSPTGSLVIMRSREVWIPLLTLQVFVNVLFAHPPPLRPNSSEIQEIENSTETLRAHRSPQPPVVALLIPSDYFQGDPGKAENIMRQFGNYRPIDSEKYPSRKVDPRPIRRQENLRGPDLQREIDRGIEDVFYPKQNPMKGFEDGVYESYLQAVPAQSERQGQKVRKGNLKEVMRGFLKPKNNLHRPQTILGSSLANADGSEQEQNSHEIFEKILSSNGKEFGFDSEDIPVEGAYLTKITTYNISKLVDENNKKGFIIEKRENFSTNLNYLDSNEKLTNYSDAHSSSLQRVLGHSPREKQRQTYIPLTIYYAPNGTAIGSESIAKPDGAKKLNEDRGSSLGYDPENKITSIKDKNNDNEIHSLFKNAPSEASKRNETSEKIPSLQNNKTPDTFLEDQKPKGPSEEDSGVFKSDEGTFSEVSSSKAPGLSSDDKNKTSPEFVGGQYVEQKEGLSNNTYILANLTDHNHPNDFVGGQFVKKHGDKQNDETGDSASKSGQRTPFQFVDGQLIDLFDKNHLSMKPGTTEKSPSDFVGGQFVVEPKTRDELLGLAIDKEGNHPKEFVGGQFVKENKDQVIDDENETTPSTIEEIPSLSLNKNTSRDEKIEKEPKRKNEVLKDTDKDKEKMSNLKGLENLRGRSRLDEDEQDERLKESPKKDSVIASSESDQGLKNVNPDTMISYIKNTREEESLEEQKEKVDTKGVGKQVSVYGDEDVAAAKEVSDTDGDFLEEGSTEDYLKYTLAPSFDPKKQNLALDLLQNQPTSRESNEEYFPKNSSESQVNNPKINKDILGDTVLNQITSLPPMNLTNNYPASLPKYSGGISNSSISDEKVETQQSDTIKPRLKENVVFEESDDGVDVTVSVYNSPEDKTKDKSSSESTESSIQPDSIIDSREDNKLGNTGLASKAEIENISKEDFSEDDTLGAEHEGILLRDPGSGRLITEVVGNDLLSSVTEPGNVDAVKEDSKSPEGNASPELSLSAAEVATDNVVGDYSIIHSNRLKSQGNKSNEGGVYPRYEVDENPQINKANGKQVQEVDDVELYAGKRGVESETDEVDNSTTIPETESTSPSENPTKQIIDPNEDHLTELCLPLAYGKNLSLFDLLSGHFYFEKDGKKIALSFKDNPLKNCTSDTRKCKLFLDFKNENKTFKISKDLNSDRENKLFSKVKNVKRHLPEEDLKSVETEKRVERSTEISDPDLNNEKVPGKEGFYQRRTQVVPLEEKIHQETIIANEKDTSLDEPEAPPHYNSKGSPSRLFLEPTRPKPVLFSPYKVGNGGNDFTEYLNNRRSSFQDLLNRQVVTLNNMDSEDRDYSSKSSRGNYQDRRVEAPNKRRPARRIAQERSVLDTEGDSKKEGACGCSSNAILQKAQPEALSYKHFVGKRNDILTTMVHAVKDWVVDTQM